MKLFVWGIIGYILALYVTIHHTLLENLYIRVSRVEESRGE